MNIEYYRHDMWCGMAEWITEHKSYHLEHHWNIDKGVKPNFIYEFGNQPRSHDMPSWWMLTY